MISGRTVSEDGAEIAGLMNRRTACIAGCCCLALGYTDCLRYSCRPDLMHQNRTTALIR
jgi:hypothetical protein